MIEEIIKKQTLVIKELRKHSEKNKTKIDAELKDKALIMVTVFKEGNETKTEGILLSNLQLKEQAMVLGAIDQIRNKLMDELVRQMTKPSQQLKDEKPIL